MDRNFPGTPRIKKMLATGTHVLIRVKDGITLDRIGAFFPIARTWPASAATASPSPSASSSTPSASPGRNALELFDLITDLPDDAAYPAGVLAAAYPWRFLSALAVFGGTRVAVGLPLLEAGPPHVVQRQAAARKR
jgi:hypothetical protein